MIEILSALKKCDVRAIGTATTRNFTRPIQTIIPWATTFYTETLIDHIRRDFADEFWGFWMLGGMSGGGMGFIFAPEQKQRGQERKLPSRLSQAHEHPPERETGTPLLAIGNCRIYGPMSRRATARLRAPAIGS